MCVRNQTVHSLRPLSFAAAYYLAVRSFIRLSVHLVCVCVCVFHNTHPHRHIPTTTAPHHHYRRFSTVSFLTSHLSLFFPFHLIQQSTFPVFAFLVLRTPTPPHTAALPLVFTSSHHNSANTSPHTSQHHFMSHHQRIRF